MSGFAGGPGPVSAIAHRGASRTFPENTLRAFDEALKQGCDAIELDLQLSLDEVPVVYHDRTLVRAGGGRRRVARMGLEELRRLDPAARFDSELPRQHIPTLEEVLRRYAHRTRLLLEIKIREGRAGHQRHLLLAGKLVDAVRRLGVEDRVSVLCFDTDVLAEVARLAPRLPRVLNVRPLPLLGRTLRRRLESLAALSVDARTLTTAFAGQLRRARCPLIVFTCNTRQRVDQALAAGAVGIMSDRPGWLRAQLQRSEAR